MARTSSRFLLRISLALGLGLAFVPMVPTLTQQPAAGDAAAKM